MKSFFSTAILLLLLSLAVVAVAAETDTTTEWMCHVELDDHWGVVHHDDSWYGAWFTVPDGKHATWGLQGCSNVHEPAIDH